MYYKFRFLLLTTVFFLNINANLENDFKLNSMSNKEVTLSQYKNQIVLIEWFSFYCDECNELSEEIKMFFEELKTNFKREEFDIITINLDDENRKKIVSLAKERGVDDNMLLDPEGRSAEKFDLPGMPYFVLLDKDKNVIDKFDEFNEDVKDDIFSQIKKHL